MLILFSLIIALFVLMDFIGLIPIFISLTKNFTHKEKVRAAFFSSFLAGGIILLFAVLGHSILRYFHVSIEALKVGGGLMLFYVAFGMIFFGPGSYNEGEDFKSIIVSPLAIPLLAGPGSMTFAMVAFAELSGLNKIFVPLSILITSFIGALILYFSSYINNFLGKEFIRGFEKITAIVLATIASEMIMSGVKIYFNL